MKKQELLRQITICLTAPNISFGPIFLLWPFWADQYIRIAGGVAMIAGLSVLLGMAKREIETLTESSIAAKEKKESQSEVLRLINLNPFLKFFLNQWVVLLLSVVGFLGMIGIGIGPFVWMAIKG